MAIRTKKYLYEGGNEQEPDRAVQITVKNYVELSSWVKGVNAKEESKPSLAIVKVDKNGVESDHRIRISTPVGIRVGRVGDYVLKDWSGYYYIIKEADFLNHWTAL